MIMATPPQIQKQITATELSKNAILSGFAGVLIELAKLHGSGEAEQKLADTLSHFLKNSSLTKSGERFIKEKIQESATLRRTYAEYIKQVLARLEAGLEI